MMTRATLPLFPRQVMVLFWPVLLAFVLAACNTELAEPDLPENNTSLPGVELFETDDVFTPEQNAAIVVVGIRADTPLSNNTVAALWRQYDPNRGRLVGEGTSLIVRYSGSDQNRDTSRVLYYVFRVRPGYYILQEAATTFRPNGFSILSAPEIIHPSSLILVKRENFGVEYYDRLYVPFGQGRAELNRDNLLNDLLSATVSHRFYVNPGDLVYLGNFVVGKEAPWVSPIERDDEAVKALLASYPNLSGQLVFRDSLVPANIMCAFTNQEEGLDNLRLLVVQNRITPENLSRMGCDSGIRPARALTDVAPPATPTIDFDSPLTSQNRTN